VVGPTAARRRCVAGGRLRVDVTYRVAEAMTQASDSGPRLRRDAKGICQKLHRRICEKYSARSRKIPGNARPAKVLASSTRAVDGGAGFQPEFTAALTGHRGPARAGHGCRRYFNRPSSAIAAHAIIDASRKYCSAAVRSSHAGTCSWSTTANCLAAA
jgi:hypothetical protein